MRKKILSTACVFALALSLVTVTAARAQSVLEGKITGTVTDDKGESLPGVTVELTGPSIMGKRASVTSARGTYVFLNVPPGTFTLTATMPSFKKWLQEGIILGAGKVIEINPVLQLGGIEETITVVGASPTVDAKTSTVDSRLEKEMIAKLPTSRDAFYDLSLTTPGMFDHGSSGGWLPSPTAYSGSSNENVFLVNGVNATNPRGSSFGTLVHVNYNAVEEVRVVALGSKAEYGSFSGAAIDVLTKSGSNTFHGNAAFYFEPEVAKGATRRAPDRYLRDVVALYQPGRPALRAAPPSTTTRPTRPSAARSSRTRSGSSAPSTTSTAPRRALSARRLSATAGGATPTSRSRPNPSRTTGPGSPTTTRATTTTAGAGAASRIGTRPRATA